jgi:hypothetical protein
MLTFSLGQNFSDHGTIWMEMEGFLDLHLEILRSNKTKPKLQLPLLGKWGQENLDDFVTLINGNTNPKTEAGE